LPVQHNTTNEKEKNEKKWDVAFHPEREREREREREKEVAACENEERGREKKMKTTLCFSSLLSSSSEKSLLILPVQQTHKQTNKRRLRKMREGGKEEEEEEEEEKRGRREEEKEENRKQIQILIVNDDGIDANGIKTLIRTLAKEKEFNVCVVAPERERSASGHCITVHEPIGVKRLSDYYHDDAYNDDDDIDENENEREERRGEEGEEKVKCKSYSITGTPADCSMLALGPDLFPELIKTNDHSTNNNSTGGAEFDIVLSGVNRGDNAGKHVMYSGTVAGAREAAMKGQIGVALSLDSYSRSANYSESCKIALQIVKSIVSSEERKRLLRGLVINVNVPRDGEKIRGVETCAVSKCSTIPLWKRVKDPNPEVLYVTHDDGEEDARAPSPMPSPPSSPRNSLSLERKSSKILSSPKKRDSSDVSGAASGNSKDFDTSDYFKTNLNISKDDGNGTTKWRTSETRWFRNGFGGTERDDRFGIDSELLKQGKVAISILTTNNACLTDPSYRFDISEEEAARIKQIGVDIAREVADSCI
jgi:5'-nucleotidase